MIRVLIGHRGVGKSALLKRISQYFPELECFDLDDEISKTRGKSITDVFRELGETRFREIEAEEFQKLIRAKPKAFISLGAGFPVSSLADSIEAFWVRRKTDSWGRIFLNRPRLNPMLTPLAEFQERFPARERAYENRADQVYQLSEGLDQANDIEKEIWSAFLGQTQVQAPEASMTLENLDQIGLEKIKNWNFRYFEMRDDGYSFEENLERWNLVRQLLPREKILLSFRSPQLSSSLFLRIQTRLEGAAWDWALELGAPPLQSEPAVLSLHELQQSESVTQGLRRLTSAASSSKTHLKAALKIRTWSDLKVGLDWQAEAPEQRSFLPRSENEKWTWVRLWLKGRQKINFVKQNVGSASDQPSLFEWQSTPSNLEEFGAILGDPVLHSKSPVTHSRFLRIQVSEPEAAMAFPILERMGLVRAAVTSPLKHWAFESFSERSEIVSQLKSANTLTRRKNGWVTENTDQLALLEIAKDFHSAESMLVWGGGGTLSGIQAAFPIAKLYSVRTGQERDISKTELIQEVDLLIWAAGPEAELPGFLKKINQIFDLNYREDSRARELALKTGAKYFSGDQMFQIQAKAQQQIWQKMGSKS